MVGDPKGFQRLVAWQKAYALVLTIYKATSAFPRTEQYGMISQMQRSAVSVPANIAEGPERGHRKDYVRFLALARGSLAELETYLLLARDLGYIDVSSEPHRVAPTRDEPGFR